MKTAILVLVVIARVAAAGTFHVATTGSDSATGGDMDPWRTIQHAADRAGAGDTVIVHAGTYVGFSTSTVASASAPLAFTADGTVNIDGAATSGQDAILVDGGAWITIEGFTITHGRRAGVAAVNCDHITVRGNHVDLNAKWGVFSGFCENFLVEGNELSRSGTQHGVYASNSADHPVIRNNYIWGNAQCGVHLNGDISQGGDGVISGAIVEGNVIRDNGRLGCSGINGDGITGAVIRNNVIDGNHASGISLYDEDGGAPSTGNLVIANTVRMASDARWALNIQNGSSGNVVRDNVLLDTAHGAIDICAACLTGMISDHNAVTGTFSIDGNVMSLAAWRAQTKLDASSFAAAEADLFVDAAASNLALRAGSPAIDAADPKDAPDFDVLGIARPQGSGFDIGAYEYCDGTCTSGTGSGSDGGAGSGSGSGSGGGGDDGNGQGSGHHGGCTAGRSGSLLVMALVLGLVLRRSRRS